MVVYVEYVLAENFMLDCALLALSLHAAKAVYRKKNLVFSSLFGALFALFFPLLSMPAFCAFAVKIFIGFFMCFLTFPHLKTKKQRSRYASICFFFFCFSFVFAGALFTVFSQNEWANSLQKLPFAFVFSAFVFLYLCTRKAIAKLYQKKRVFQHVYSCAIPCNKRLIEVLGFLDSGNKATKNNVPVCFISPVIAYEIWQGNILDNTPKKEKSIGQVFIEQEKCREQICVEQEKCKEQVCVEQEKDTWVQTKQTTATKPLHDTLHIRTVSGEKTLSLRLGELQIQYNKTWITAQVYFAVSTHILSQTYDLLLPANILDDNR